MEFKEVENINKEVIVKVKDKIHLKELMAHMEKWDFSTMTIQSIKAEINNHGEAYAVIQFLDSVKRRPVTFPKMMAALKETKQYDVYEIFRKQIGKYFNRKKERLQEVLSMISKEEEDLGITEDHDDTAGKDNAISTGGQSSSNTQAGNQYSQDKYRMDYSGQARGDSSQSSDNSTPTRAIFATGVSSQLDNNPPGASCKAYHDSQNQALNPHFAGASISDLKANVYKMLGQALERTNTHGDDREPWWNYIINNGDINVNRKEQRKIGKQGSPGVEFLDILDDRDYTLADLERMFIQFRIDEALDILHQHQDKVIDDRISNENNLNVNQRSKADANKDMNISAPSTESSEGQNDKSQTVQVLLKQSSSQVENKESSSSKLERNRNSGPINISRPDSSSSDLLSIESNTDISSIIEDDSIKGTKAVQAHGDQSNTQSQLNPDDDAMKLRNDRVHQFDLDPGAIENTSFIPVRRTNGTQNNSQTNEAEQSNSNIQSDQEGRMRNNEQSDETGEDVNNPVEPNEPSGSQGNLPLLSGFSMVVDNVREGQVQGQNVEPGGVVNIPPRSLDSHEKDFTERTGVNLVPPSIESQSSIETTEDSRQSGDENNQTTGSIGEPDLIQGTHCGTGPCENVSADENPEN